MQKLSGAVQLGIGLFLGLLLGLGIVGSVNVSRTARTTTTTVPTVTVHQPVYEFFAAHTGVQCEIVTNLTQQGPVPLNQITCFTNEPARRVALDDVGKINKCDGMTCLANPGLNTPYLAVGTKIASGNHHCEVVVNGARCGNATSATFTMTAKILTTAGQDPIGIWVTEPVYEFFAPVPSGVECEMTPAEVLCITQNPPRRAVVDGHGRVTTCNGEQCLSNPGIGTPTLLAGTKLMGGVLDCTVKEMNVECFYKDVRGFSMSKAGVTQLP